MLASLRRIKLDLNKISYSKCRWKKVSVLLNRHLVPTVSDNLKNKLIYFTASDGYSNQYLSQKIGYIALITAFCFDKRSEEKCQENSQLDEFETNNNDTEKLKYNPELSKNEENNDKKEDENKKKHERECIWGEINEKCDGKKHSQNREKMSENNSLHESNKQDNMKQNEEKTYNVSDKYREIQNHDSLFMEAAKDGDIEDIKRLLEEGVDVNQRHSYGWTALHVAVINGHFRVVAELLSYGADPDLGDNFSSLKEVAWEKQLKDEEVTAVRKQEFYSKMKMEVNCRNRTALHYAVDRQDYDIVSILLRYGADPTILSETGISPFDLAKSERLRNLLRKYVDRDDEEIMRLHSYVKRLINKGYSVNVSTPKKEHGEKSDNIGPIKIQVRDISTNELIKDMTFNVRFKKKFVTI